MSEIKKPYIKGDKLVFDARDKATIAMINEYANASIFHGTPETHPIKQVEAECNLLLKKLRLIQNKDKFSYIERLLNDNGWVIECESPFELRHTDGSFASGQAAIIVRDTLIDEDEDEEA